MRRRRIRAPPGAAATAASRTSAGTSRWRQCAGNRARVCRQEGVADADDPGAQVVAETQAGQAIEVRCRGGRTTISRRIWLRGTAAPWPQPLRQHGRRNYPRRGRTDQDLARFPHGMKPAPYPSDHDLQTARPLRDCAGAGICDLGRATPSLSHAPSDTFSSKSARPQPTTARVRRPSEPAACFPAGPAAPRSAAATRRRAYGIPHGCGRARPDPCTPRCGRTC